MHVSLINVQRMSARTKHKIMGCAKSMGDIRSALARDVRMQLSEEECVESMGQHYISAVTNIVIKSFKIGEHASSMEHSQNVAVVKDARIEP